MASVIYGDQKYPLVERPTFGELEWVEKQAKADYGSMTGMAKNRGYILIALRRAGIHLTWADTADLSPADITSDEDDTPAPEAGEDPTRHGSVEDGPAPAA